MCQLEEATFVQCLSKVVTPIKWCLDQSIEGFVQLEHDCFIRPGFKSLWYVDVDVFVEGGLNKSIAKVDLMCGHSSTGSKRQHELDSRKGYDWRIFFRVIYPFHLFVPPGTEVGFELLEPPIRVAFYLEGPCAWQDIHICWEIFLGHHGPCTMFLQLADFLMHGLLKLLVMQRGHDLMVHGSVGVCGLIGLKCHRKLTNVGMYGVQGSPFGVGEGSNDISHVLFLQHQ